jgi:Ca2+-binding RTX toxin-like protein
MNMISTGTFLNGMDASNKQSELVKKLVAAWEKKNSKAARAGGVSLMALSLAACGGEDTTPFAQSDIDAATAPLAAAAIVAGAALAAAQADAAAALVAQSAAETQAATALVAQAAAEASAAGLTVTAASATASAAAATVAQAAAEASLATAQAALTAANAEKATLQTSYDSLVASNTTLQTSYDALVAPRSDALTTSATPDALQGASGNDVFTGVAGTLAATDSIRDGFTTDNDSLTITDTDGTIGQFTVQNIENVNLNINSLTANVNVDATNFTGVSNLTVSRGDITIGGATLTGASQVDVIALDATDVAKVTTAGTVGIVNVTQATKSGVVIDADNATGAVTVVGAATVNAAGMGVGDTLTVTAGTNAQMGGTAALRAVENAKAVTVDTNAAIVTIANGAGTGVFTGVINVTAPAATAVTIPAASGGATVSAAGSSTNGVDIRGIDASGATVTTTVNQAATAAAQIIDLAAVNTASVTATATVSALGNVALDTGAATDAIDTLTLSGNGGAVTYTITSTSGTTETINATSDVTVAGNEAIFAGNTVTGAAAINLASTSTAGTIAAGLWSATEIGVAFNNANNAITAAAGQNYELTVNQTGLDFDYGATVVDQDITITAGDVNGTSTAVGTLTLGALDVTSGTATSGTVSIIANESNLTATSVTAATTQDITITGDEDVNLGTVATANSINSQGSTGNTTATLGAAAKSISSGSGTDTIVLSGNRIHTVDSGAGVDTLTITSTAATSTINAGAGDDAITVTDVDQYVVLGGDGADNVNVGVAAGATLMGGAGSDTLTITTGGVTLAAGFLTNSVENLNLSASNGTTAFTSTQFAGLAGAKITGNTATDVLQVTATAAGGAMDYSGLTKTTGSTQTVNYVLGAGADTVTGTSAFSETFIMNDLKGVDSIAGGAGTGNIDALSSNDTTYKEVSTSNTSTGIIVNLGDAAVTGVDILSGAASHLADGVTSVNGGTITQLYGAADTTKVNSNVVDTVSGIENFTSSDAAGIEYVVGTSGNNVISVGAGADYVDGGSGNDTITGAAGIDKLVGGDGDDTFIYVATADLVASSAVVDSITGGLGSLDAISISNNGGSTFTIASGDDLARISGVEIIKATGASDTIITITSHADAHIDGFRTIDLSTDTDATANNVIDASNTTTGGLTLKGSAGIDTITGTGAVDTIVGGGGADIINGGAGADVIQEAFGGEGVDAITFVVGVGGDVIDLTGTSDIAGGAVDADGFLLLAGTAAVSIIDGLTVINGANATAVDAGAILTAAEIATFLGDMNGGGTGTLKVSMGAASDVGYIVVEGQANGSVLARVTGGANTTIDAADITILATFASRESEDFIAANFADFA